MKNYPLIIYKVIRNSLKDLRFLTLLLSLYFFYLISFLLLKGEKDEDTSLNFFEEGRFRGLFSLPIFTDILASEYESLSCGAMKTPIM
jgi:hypothetical protein